MGGEQVEESVGLIAVSSALVNRKLAHLLALAQRLNFLTDEIPEAVKFDQTLWFRSHEQVTPDARRAHRVVNEELERAVDLEDTLGDSFGWRVLFIGERNTNSKPPAQGLKRIISNVLGSPHAPTHPAIAQCSFHIAIVRQDLAFGQGKPIGARQVCCASYTDARTCAQPSGYPPYDGARARG